MSNLPPITDRSYGIIPIRLTTANPLSTPTSSPPSTKPKLTTQNTQLLLIYQRTLNGSTFWCFPKGHPESIDESVKYTAIRELEEETGLKIGICNLIDIYSKNDEKTEIQLKERYINPRRKQGKEVTYYLALIPQPQELRLQEKEVADARWVSWEQAAGMIKFDECREVLDVVGEALGDGKDGKDGKEEGEEGGVVFE